MLDAQRITRELGGRWHGAYGSAPCPVCQPERRLDQNGLSIKIENGKLLTFCHKSGCSFRDVAAAMGIAPGTYAAPDPAIIAQHEADRRAEAEKRAQKARAIWDAAQPIWGTIAETYLRGRAITCALPETLRFDPECWHGPTARRWPALVARVDGGAGFAVHRTYLRGDGTSKAPVDPPKAMLGACAGGAVRLSRAPGRLVVAEGIETALSLACGLLEGPATIWAALSTSGMRGLILPERPGRLTVASDGDAPGRAAALALAERARAGGWRVDYLDPGDRRDFNDLLREGMAE